MGKISYNLLPKQKSLKRNMMVEVDLYPYATELCNELNSIGVIDRIKNIPQLGVIKSPKKLSKTRYDYVMLQLYLHQLIKSNLQQQLRFTYNNPVKNKEFHEKYLITDKKFPSIGDILQLLTIIYNIGHFYNTFTASRAVIMMSSYNELFNDMIINASKNERYKSVASKIIESKNYQRFHLLNSILVLEQCDQTKQSISLSLEILYSYLNEEFLSDENKLRYIFSIFRKVRTVSYIAYDLQIANTPLSIDICNKEAMILILKELLSEYNNNEYSNHLINSINKLLDDTVYNKASDAICYYQISRRMVSRMTEIININCINYFTDLFFDKDSVLNCAYSHKHDYMSSQILKVTFAKEDRRLSECLLSELERIQNTRVGYYDRHLGEQTLLISIKKSCSASSKTVAAFKVMKCIIRALRKLTNISDTDVRYLLCTKFFLYYLFNENPLVIKPTIDKTKCVICTRGKKSRINRIELLLHSSTGNDSENHEIQFMLDLLKADEINDTSITIPASIIVYPKNHIGRKLCEFDGLIIHPMRKANQIIFLEAKNTSQKPSLGKNCLKDKLDKLSIEYKVEDIIINGHDALWEHSI